MMSSGFAEMKSNLSTLRANAPVAMEAAVDEVAKAILADSQGLVRVKTGKLKSTGKKSVETNGTVTIATVSYGNAETVTQWHGVGYEIFVHTPGTKWYGGVPYLEQPTMDHAHDLPDTIAKVLG